LSITTSDGYSIATGVKFRALPLLLLVRPTGRTVQDSSIFLNHQGEVTESALLSWLGLERSRGDPIAAEQDIEFEQAVEIDNERAAAVRERERERESVQEDFENLPELRPGDPNVCTIRMHLPNSRPMVKVFPRAGKIAMLFAFANHFVAPRVVALYTGHPLQRIENLEAEIGSICPGTQFVVYALYDDEE
jgi:hypothetical protein